ncbi:Mitochondria fission 1 protein [Smittium culicis]|uniref:Mitochondrial fission 1 protein n=1 Tax=Smittium culicis TaxID=133412 RepID=A0A1R1Y508_9FUNG|nr:Mitochondria fission 1 protein [Smittium culicis]OMJ21978.1 Mitochondria fission 1 protein [Smittium culicis]
MLDEKEGLPYAVDAETPLEPQELLVLQRQYEREGRRVGVQTKFNYAWGLVKSKSPRDQQLGVDLLQEIFIEYPERQRECLYYISLGHYKLSNYNEATRFNNALLTIEPENKQAVSLQKLIDEKCASEGLLGMAIAGGAVAAIGAIALALLKRK